MQADALTWSASSRALPVASDAGAEQRRVAESVRLFDGGMSSKQELYALRTTSFTCDFQGKAKVNLVCHAVQEAGNCAVVAARDRMSVTASIIFNVSSRRCRGVN